MYFSRHSKPTWWYLIAFSLCLSITQLLRYFIVNPPRLHLETNPSIPIESMLEGDSFVILKTKTKPSFFQVLPNPLFDRFNTPHLMKHGTIHPKFTVLLHHLMPSKCEKGSLFVDCGANFGYFSLYAASMGCRVISIEPNPYLEPILKQSIRMNHFENKMTFYNKIISDESGKEEVFWVHKNHWGLSHVASDENNEGERIIGKTVKIDDIVHEDVFVLKIDVEGSELKALESAKKLISKFRVEHIFVEWERVSKHPQATEFLQWLQNQNYEILSLPHESYNEPVKDWDIDEWSLHSVPISSISTLGKDLWIRKKI